MTENKHIGSPCIGFCSTTYGDDFCKGCYRHYEQVIDWEQLAYETKKDFYRDIAKVVKESLGQLVTIEDKEAFIRSCLLFNIEIQADIPVEYHIFQLIQKASLQLEQDTCGLKKHTTMTWSQLYSRVDKDIYKKVSQVVCE